MFLWRFHWDCRRMGSVDGLFVATEEEVAEAVGNDVRFGEILGKHSDVYGELKAEDVEKVDLDTETVEKVAALLGGTWSGHNPLLYVQRDCAGPCQERGIMDEFGFRKVDGIWLCANCAPRREDGVS